MYFIGSCVCCTCLVFGLGVAHDNGDWDDEPGFLKPGSEDDYRRPVVSANYGIADNE